METTPVIQQITYLDSNLINEQTDEIVKPCVITAVGFLIHENSESVTLARELIDDEYRGQVAIPKIAITKRTFL